MKIDRNTPVNELPEFLTPDELRAFLGLSRNGVYEMVQRGEIPVKRFGRKIFIPRKVLAK